MSQLWMTHSAPAPRRRSRSVVSRLLVAVAALAALMVAQGAGAPLAAAEDCVGGVVNAEVVAASLPGGQWSVTDVCIPQDTFFELNQEGYRLVLGLATVTYDDGHTGRLAVGTLKYSDTEALTIVGVEDFDTELVKWAGTLGSYESSGTLATMAGDGIAILPEEPASLALSVDGIGTDIAPLIGPDVDPNAPTTTVLEEVVPEATTTTTPAPSPTTTAAPATTVPATTVPATTVPAAPPDEPGDTAPPG